MFEAAEPCRCMAQLTQLRFEGLKSTAAMESRRTKHGQVPLVQLGHVWLCTQMLQPHPIDLVPSKVSTSSAAYDSPWHTLTHVDRLDANNSAPFCGAGKGQRCKNCRRRHCRLSTITSSTLEPWHSSWFRITPTKGYDMERIVPSHTQNGEGKP